MVELKIDSDFEAALGSDLMRTDPHRVYRRLRDAQPVFRSAAAGGWLATTYDLVEEVLTDPGRFSSAGAEIEFIDRLDPPPEKVAPTLQRHFATPQLNTSDPPDHTRIRRAFGRSFLSRRISAYADMIDEAATDFLEKAAAGRRFDAARAFAEPLPVRVISDIVGVPDSHRHRIPVVTMHQRHFFGSVSPHATHAVAFNDTLAEWHRFLIGWIEHRRAEPRDDILTRAAEVIDEGLITTDEAAATLLHFIIAGNGTTTALIGNTIYALLAHPDHLAEAVSSPGLVENAIEESLRWEAPLPRDRRIATGDTRLGGTRINAGDRVYAVLAAANRDPAQFAEPDAFDVHRRFTAKHHAAFGRGIHFCLGAPVARLEARVAVQRFLAMFPNARLGGDFTPTWHAVPTHRGLETIPVEV